MAVVKARTISTADFLNLPEEVHQSASVELLYGEVIEMPKPSWEHNYLASSLMATIARHARKHRLGKASTDCLVILDQDSGVALAPDVVYLSTEKLAQIQHGRVYGTPDLVVEVISPSSEIHDRIHKLPIYHRYRVPWVWLIELEPLHLEEYQWSEAGYIRVQAVAGDEPFTPRLFPRLTFKLSDL